MRQSMVTRIKNDITPPKGAGRRWLRAGSLSLIFEKKGQKMQAKDLKKELFRRYQWIDPVTGNSMMHEIQEPQTLYLGKTTHRILDTNGLVHFVPSIGYFGCVLVTENKDKSEPCNF